MRTGQIRKNPARKNLKKNHIVIKHVRASKKINAIKIILKKRLKFSCIDKPGAGSESYTAEGSPHASQQELSRVELSAGLVGLLVSVEI